MKEVPFYECHSLKRKEAKRYEFAQIGLSGGRIVEVGVAEDGERCVSIKKPINEELMSVLEFGITEEAASALAFLINKTFHRVKPDEEAD